MLESRKVLVAAALGGIFNASLCFAEGEGSAAADKKMTKDEAMGECHGVNECKGRGECKAKGHGCGGKNSCKGKGWVKLDKASCLDQKGKFKAMKM